MNKNNKFNIENHSQDGNNIRLKRIKSDLDKSKIWLDKIKSELSTDTIFVTESQNLISSVEKNQSLTTSLFQKKILFYYAGFTNTNLPFAGSSLATIILATKLAAINTVSVHVTGDHIIYQETYNKVVFLPLPEAEKRDIFLSQYDVVIFSTLLNSFSTTPKFTNQVWILHQHNWHIGDKELRRVDDFDTIICLSDIHRQSVIKQGFPCEKIRILHNGVDINLFNPQSIRREPHSIMFAGAIVEHKGIHILIDALREVRLSFPDAEVHIYGSSSMWRDSDKYENKIKKLEVECVNFYGAVANHKMPLIYSQHSVLCLPSVIESFGMVAVEAQACGCIPIVHQAGGVEVTMMDGETGFLYSPNTHQELAKTIIKALKLIDADPSIRQRAISFVDNQFNINAIFGEFLGILSERIENYCHHVEKKNPPIIFIHKGDSDYLQHTLKSAKIFNPNTRIILLGDESNKHYQEEIGIEYFSFSQCEGEESQKFDKNFKYIAGTQEGGGEWWVRFVFKRWFHLLNFVRSNHIRRFWTFDSDNLILSNLEDQVSKFLEYDCTEQCNGWCINGLVNGLEVIKGYIDKINDLFLDTNYLDKQRREFINNPTWAFTEMRAYVEYKESVPFKSVSLNTIIDGETFDECLCQQHDMEMEVEGGKKKLYFENGNLYERYLPTQQLVKLNSINMSWLPTSFIKEIFDYASQNYTVTVSPSSQLNFLIPPEIKNDEFYEIIQKLAKEEDIRTVLEIGSSAGEGSTEAFVTGLRQNPNHPILFCMEISKPRFAALQQRYANNFFVKAYNVSSVSLQQFPNEQQVQEFYKTIPTILNNYPIEEIIRWLRQDIEYVKNSGVPSDGIFRIKRENEIDVFDLVLIDGSEFTGESELKQVYGAKIIALDDTNCYKNYKNRQTLLADPTYEIIADNQTVRNGYSIFKRLFFQESSQNNNNNNHLPIHFFTIVLNGQPFIQYHLDVFKQLPFQWHWHIVEGVADLKHDTAWSLQFGGRITDEIHKNGLSYDGTTEYLDELKRCYPNNISVYRKQQGIFWDGKLEMVKANLANINQECLLWQIDVDELWTVDQFCTARQMFINNPGKTAAWYWCWYFVGENLVVSTRECYSQNSQQEWLRTWRYKPGMAWESHEPPRLMELMPNGAWQDVASVNPFRHSETEDYNLIFQHFAYVTIEQVLFKEKYYGYKDAVVQWKQLQSQTKFPIFLRDYFGWVHDQTMVNTIQECGITPLAYKLNDGNLYFASSQNSLTIQAEPVTKNTAKVVVDGVFFQLNNTGIARVWKSLLEEWVISGFSQQIIVLDREETAPKIPGIRYRNVPRYDYSQTETDKKMLQQICDAERSQVFISSYYTTPISTPSVFMAYDMIPEVMVSGGDIENDPMWREKHYAIRQASAFVAISENTGRDLVKCFPDIPIDLVTVAHCGIDKNLSTATIEEIESFRSKFAISKPYFLMVGDRLGWGHTKNGTLFFKSFDQLPNRCNFEIVCVGGKPTLEPEFEGYVMGVKVHMLRLSNEELKLSYAGAVALVYPSLYEGFGMPVVEAMACGCPVITCPISSIPEVAGSVPIYINPNDVQGLCAALQEVQKPEIRQFMTRQGLERSKQFSWAKMAKLIAEILEKTAINQLK